MFLDELGAWKSSQEARSAEVALPGRNCCAVKRAGSEKHSLTISQERLGKPDQKAPYSRASKSTCVVDTNRV